MFRKEKFSQAVYLTVRCFSAEKIMRMKKWRKLTTEIMEKIKRLIVLLYPSCVRLSLYTDKTIGPSLKRKNNNSIFILSYYCSARVQQRKRKLSWRVVIVWFISFSLSLLLKGYHSYSTLSFILLFILSMFSCSARIELHRLTISGYYQLLSKDPPSKNNIKQFHETMIPSHTSFG